MSSLSSREFLQKAQEQVSILREELSSLTTAQETHNSRKKKFEISFEKALEELCALNLPRLDQNVFDQVLQRTGYGQFRVKNPLIQMEEERKELIQKQEMIQNDPSYQDRINLIHPVTGNLVREEKETSEQLNAIQSAVAQYEDEFFEQFQTLIQRGYGTESYPYQWWNWQYYQDWKWGDIFAEKFEKETFSEVGDVYRKLVLDRNVLHRSLEESKQEIARIKSLESEFLQNQYQLENLLEITLSSCRNKLKEHLLHIDREQLFEWSKGDRAREAMVKRLHGIEKKIEYLEEMSLQYLSTDQKNLERKLEKLLRKITKYQRPKHARTRIPQEDAQSWLQNPREKLQKRRKRFWKHYERVESFERYDAYDYAKDVLWWDLITDGQIDGNFIPEVQQWRETHPEEVFQSESLQHAAVSISDTLQENANDDDLWEVS